MRTLAIHTATRFCSLALFDDRRMISHSHVDLGRGHAEYLIPAIGQLPDGGRATQILVDTGPGSFTGVRIGHAAANGLAIAWQAKLFNFSTLSLADATAAASHAGWRDHARAIVLEGGHGQWFVGTFAPHERHCPDVASMLPEDAIARIGDLPTAGNRAEELAGRTAGATVNLAVDPDAQYAFDTDWSSGPGAGLLYGRGPDAKPLQRV